MVSCPLGRESVPARPERVAVVFVDPERERLGAVAMRATDAGQHNA